MALGERGLDRGLALQQPVERGVELVLVDLAEAEHFAEAGGGGGGRQRTGGGELGGGFEDAADEQGEDEVTAAMAVGAEDTVEADLAGGAESGGDVAVRQAADDGEGVALGGDDGAAFEHAAQTFDVGGGPVGEIAEGAFADLAVLAIALAQQDGGGRVPVGDGFDIHGEVWAHPAGKCTSIKYWITWLHFRPILPHIAAPFQWLGSSGKKEARVKPRPHPTCHDCADRAMGSTVPQGRRIRAPAFPRRHGPPRHHPGRTGSRQ